MRIPRQQYRFTLAAVTVPATSPVTLTARAELVRLATPEDYAAARAARGRVSTRAPDWRRDMDEWRVTVCSPHCEQGIEFPYFSGLGLRRWCASVGLHAMPMRPTLHDFECSRAQPPRLINLLESLALDASTYLEARDEREPEDYLAEQMGCERPSEARDLFAACRKTAFDLARLLDCSVERAAEVVTDFVNDEE